MYSNKCVKIIMTLICMLVVGNGFAQEHSEISTLKSLERQAQTLSKKGNWEDAISVYDNIISRTPSDSLDYVQAMKAKADCLRKMGKTDDALGLYTKMMDTLTTTTPSALRREKKFPAQTNKAKYTLSLELANLYTEQGDFESAEKELKRAGEFLRLAISDERLEPQEIAEFQLELNKYDEKLGEFYLKQGKLNEAIQHYEQALSDTEKVLNSAVIDNLPTESEKQKLYTIYDTLREIRYPLKLAEMYEQTGERKKARRLYKEVRRAADRALTINEKYKNTLPEFHKELQSIFERVQAKLNEMEIYGD